MASVYLIEYAYKSICFLDFLNESLKSWESVPQKNENNIDLSMSEKQQKFREINNDNLLSYYEKEKISENNPKNINSKKVEFIEEWAKTNGIKFSKNFSFEEINKFSDQIYKIYIAKLNGLKNEKNLILNLCFPQLIKNLFNLFELLNEIKTIFLKEKNLERDNYTNLLIEFDEKENTIKSYIQIEKNFKKNEKKKNE